MFTVGMRQKQIVDEIVDIVLVFDNGPEFVNEIVGDMCALHGIDRRLIAGYRPQADGQVEIFNRTQHLRQAMEWQGRAIAQAQVAQVGQRRAQDAAASSIAHVRLGAGARVFLREVHPEHKLVHRFVGFYVVVRDAVASGMTIAERASANYIIADILGVERAKSFPRDQLFAVAHPSAELSLRQSALYTVEDVASAVQATSTAQPGPLLELREEDDETDLGARWCHSTALTNV